MLSILQYRMSMELSREAIILMERRHGLRQRYSEFRKAVDRQALALLQSTHVARETLVRTTGGS